MKKNKLVIGAIVIVLVIVILVLFVKFFSFEPDKNQGEYLTYPTITDEFIDDLYTYVDGYSIDTINSMYNGSYSKVSNLSFEMIMSMAFNYIYNFDQFKLKIVEESIPVVEIENEENIDNSEESLEKETDEEITEDKPAIKEEKKLYKISEEDLWNAIKMVFGENTEINITLGDFKIGSDRKAVYDAENNEFYIYEINESTKYLRKKEIESYVVTNNGNTIYIYDYFLKCSLEDNSCYSTENLKTGSGGHKIVNNDVDMSNKEGLKIFRHEFKFENGRYYWYSTELTY